MVLREVEEVVSLHVVDGEDLPHVAGQEVAVVALPPVVDAVDSHRVGGDVGFKVGGLYIIIQKN